MSTMGVNSQRPVQSFQSQPTPAAQHKEGPALQQQAQASDPLAALSKALEALEQAVQSLTTKGFNNNQSVAQQANQNLGASGNATGNGGFNWQNLLGGGSSFDQQPTTPPVQQNTQTNQSNNDFLGEHGGGAAPAPAHVDHGLHLGNEKSGGGGGVRIGSDGANN